MDYGLIYAKKLYLKNICIYCKNLRIFALESETYMYSHINNWGDKYESDKCRTLAY